jgi:hypothetical protein
MRKCLDPNPKTRAHASDLLKHDFVRIFLFFILQVFFSPARLRTSSKTLLKNTILCALPLPVPLRPKSVFGSDGPLTRPLHASYMPLTRLLHASYTPLTRLLQASYTPLTRLFALRATTPDTCFTGTKVQILTHWRTSLRYALSSDCRFKRL